MKVVAINASPKMDKGNTAAILGPFLAGLRETGAEVELFYISQLDICPCHGDLTCWLKTPGTCFQRDDMETLLPKLAAADLWVWATPVYVDGMPGSLKNLIDRIIPLVLPFYEIRDGHCRHPLREGANSSGNVALVSSCGFWEMDNFEPLVAHVRAICRNANREFAGALLRPHIRALKSMADQGEPVSDIFDAAREAGTQLARSGAMSSRTLAVISRPLLPVEDFVNAVNKHFRLLLEEQVEQ
jgi:multimeric flavodoxin WrbA